MKMVTVSGVSCFRYGSASLFLGCVWLSIREEKT